MPFCAVELDFENIRLRDLGKLCLVQGDLNDTGNWKPSAEETWQEVSDLFSAHKTVIVNHIGRITHWCNHRGKLRPFPEIVFLSREDVPKIGH